MRAEDPAPSEAPTRARFVTLIGTARRWQLHRVWLLLVSLAIFILALQLMQAGAGSIKGLVQQTLNVSNPANALGFGWLLAYVLLSGSPVAAVALALFDEGTLTTIETYMMIAGSRLGASLFVLLVGSYYVARGVDRLRGLTIGVLSLVVVASLQLPAAALGYLLIRLGVLDGLSLEVAAFDVLDRASQPVVERVRDMLPEVGVFLFGVCLILVAFRMFDAGLPRLRVDEHRLLPSMLYRTWVMFGLGLVVTLLTLSVSVSLGILIPLTTRGLIRRENLIPYIMGCNITTYIDTLIIAMLLDARDGPAIVVAAMIANAIVSAVILLFWSGPYQTLVNGSVDWTLESVRRVAVFATLILAIPVLLMVI